MYDLRKKRAFLERVFGKSAKSTDGFNFAFSCPACSKDKQGKKKLAIRVDDDRYKCWVCDLKGQNLVSLVKRFFPQHAAEAHTYALRRGNSALEPLTTNDEVTVCELPANFHFLANSVSLDPDVRAVKDYLFSRGCTAGDLWRFKFGTCTTGRYRRRAIMPSFDVDGNLNYYVARTIDDRVPKYINSKIRKSDIVFNELDINWKIPITVVEGPFDLISAGENVVCLLGSSLNEKHKLFHMLVENKSMVYLALDPDVRKKQNKIASLLCRWDCRVNVIEFNNFGDVGEMPRGYLQDLKEKSMPWTVSSNLLSQIRAIKSGSTI